MSLSVFQKTVNAVRLLKDRDWCKDNGAYHFKEIKEILEDLDITDDLDTAVNLIPICIQQAEK